MLDKYLIEHCAPTLASIKTANLFSLSISMPMAEQHLDVWNKQLNIKGVSMEVLFKDEKRMLVYVYRKNMLKRDLTADDVSTFMRIYGYGGKSVSECLQHLKTRFLKSTGFPHEIGLFLGYPLGDVIGFIENQGKNSKCGGYWQVYCNEQEAKKQFAHFSKCRDTYKRLFSEGKTVWQLTVAA